MIPRARGRRAVSSYRCTGCGIRRKGDAGMVACPECGCALIQLYGRRKPTARADEVRGDG